VCVFLSKIISSYYYGPDATHPQYAYAYGLYDSPAPLACIFGISRLHFTCSTFTCILPVSYRILGIPLYPCIYIQPNLAILQQIHWCIPLYPTVSSCICICTYLAVLAVSVSSCIYLAVSRCISPYPTASKTGYRYSKKHTPGEGYTTPPPCGNRDTNQPHPHTPATRAARRSIYSISYITTHTHISHVHIAGRRMRMLHRIGIGIGIGRARGEAGSHSHSLATIVLCSMVMIAMATKHTAHNLHTIADNDKYHTPPADSLHE